MDEIRATGRLDVNEIRPLVSDDALVEAELALFEIPLPDSPSPGVQLRLRESPPVGFLIEDYGLIRVEQVGRLATDIADAIGLLSPFFPPISDLEGRLRALAVPDPE